MGTSSLRGARSLALVLLASLLLHGDAGVINRGFYGPDADAVWCAKSWGRSAAAAESDNKLWANETDPASAMIAERMAAVGSTYGHARLWLSGRCPRRGSDGTVSGMARRCYLRELRRLEKQLRPRPPPPEESQEEKVRLELPLMFMQSMVQMYPWPEVIRNPVIKTRLRPYRAPAPWFRPIQK